MIWQPSEAQSYYVSYGTSFDPSLEALAVTSGTQVLPPEKNESYEIGGKWDLRESALSLNAAVFEVTKTNARTQVAPGDYELDGNVCVRGEVVGIAGQLTCSGRYLAVTHRNQLAAHGFGLWYDAGPLSDPPPGFDPMVALRLIGYDLIDPTAAIVAYHRHYRASTAPRLDAGDLRILWNLQGKVMKMGVAALQAQKSPPH